MMRVDVDLLPAIEQLEGVDDRVANAVRPSTFAGAKLVKEEVELRAPQSEKAHFFYSKRRKNGAVGKKYLFKPGSLKKAIYIKYLTETSQTGQSAYYKIGWRERSSQIGYVPYAHMVEFGTSKSPAHPFLRPAFDARKKQAEQLIIEKILEAASGNSTDTGD